MLSPYLLKYKDEIHVTTVTDWPIYKWCYLKTMLIFEIEVESYQGTSSSIRLQDEIEMLVSTVEQTSHSMHKIGWYVWPR